MEGLLSMGLPRLVLVHPKSKVTMQFSVRDYKWVGIPGGGVRTRRATSFTFNYAFFFRKMVLAAWVVSLVCCFPQAVIFRSVTLVCCHTMPAYCTNIFRVLKHPDRDFYQVSTLFYGLIY